MPTCLAIQAAGRGERLLGALGGSKALYPVNGRPLIDHVLAAAARGGIQHVVVAGRARDEDLRKFLDAERRFAEVSWLGRADGGSTADTMAAVSEFLGEQDHYVSTCDVICPSDIFLRLGARVAQLTDSRILAVLACTRFVMERTPVWVQADATGAVRAFGKTLKPAPLVFGHIRWTSARACRPLRSLREAGAGSETAAMAELVRLHQGRIVAWDGGTLFDVDTPDDALMAERFAARQSKGAAASDEGERACDTDRNHRASRLAEN